jgi:hypothetical protein
MCPDQIPNKGLIVLVKKGVIHGEHKEETVA